MGQDRINAGAPQFGVAINPPDSFRVVKAPAKRLTLFVSPETGLDMEARIDASWGRKRKYLEGGGDIGVMLEDARTRCDRQHPFWNRIDF